MEEELISKKELLSRYGISYGALYRWKRKGLIPEEWFIKKATVTGQETFFDEKTICERIELIISMKDEASLDELANRFNPPAAKPITLLITTPGGTRSFRADEIRSAVISGGNRAERDVTEALRKLLEEADGDASENRKITTEEQ